MNKNQMIADAADCGELDSEQLASAIDDVRAAQMVEQQASIAEAAPFAWATFDGEGSYDLRLYECNESYRDEWLAANGRLYADWVIPLYEAPDELRARIAELEQQAAIGRRAVEMLREIEAQYRFDLVDDLCPVCDKPPLTGHAFDCKLAAILRDAEQAGMEVEL